MAAQLARIQADADPGKRRVSRNGHWNCCDGHTSNLAYDGSSGIDNDPDLAPLYDDPEFQALVVRVEASRSEV